MEWMMDQNDFATDFYSFRNELGVIRSDVNNATKHIAELAEIWGQLGGEFLGGIVSTFHLSEESRIDGSVLGKKFSIRYAPVGVTGVGVLEAVLLVEDLVTLKPIELSRFQISAKGVLLNASGDELIDLDYHDSAYKLLAVIVAKVLNASPAAQ